MKTDNAMARVLEWAREQCRGSHHVVEFGAGKLDYIIQLDGREQIEVNRPEDGITTRSLVCKGDHIKCPQRTAIEAYAEYISAWKSNDFLTVVVGDMRDYQTLGLRKFDCALFIDSIEHLHRGDALTLISRLQEDGVRIVVFAPEGIHQQSKGSWGDSNVLQAHLSTWYPRDFNALGFKTEQWAGFHKDLANGGAFTATWNPP